MKKTDIRPMIHGVIISALVVIVALPVEMAMGLCNSMKEVPYRQYGTSFMLFLYFFSS